MMILKKSQLNTPLGPMIAISDEKALYLLEFEDRRGLEHEVERLKLKTKSTLIPGHTQIVDSIEQELKLYFERELNTFKTPITSMGSPFQEKVWNELKKIPSGTTCSYANLAKAVGNPNAFRAVAQANGSNQFALIIPCHRVINANGELGGYSGGLSRKAWLINHEKRGNLQTMNE